MPRLFLLALRLFALVTLGLTIDSALPAIAQDYQAQSGQTQTDQTPADQTQADQPQASPTEASQPTQSQPIQAALGPSQFDGTYVIDVTTQDGDCDNSHWTVVVSHAQVASVSPNTANIRASGLIEDDGTVSLTFRGRASDIVHVGGTVKGRGGKGAWSAPTLLCGGIWRAQKK